MDNPIKELAPHEQRVVAEQTELNERLEKLKAFVMSDAMSTVPARSAALLLAQGELMSRLEYIMRMRISAFADPYLAVADIPEAEKAAVASLLNDDSSDMLNAVMEWIAVVNHDVKHLETLPAGSKLSFVNEGEVIPTTIVMEGDSHVAFKVAIAAVGELLSKCPIIQSTPVPEVTTTPEAPVASNDPL